MSTSVYNYCEIPITRCGQCRLGLLFLYQEDFPILISTRPYGFTTRLGKTPVYPQTDNSPLTYLLKINIHNYIGEDKLLFGSSFDEVKNQIIQHTGCYHPCPYSSHRVPLEINGEFCSQTSQRRPDSDDPSRPDMSAHSV